METTAMTLTTPAPAKDAAPASSSADRTGDAAGGGSDFAAALEQQIAHSGSSPAAPGTAAAADDAAPAEDEQSAASQPALATPDGIIALLSTPLVQTTAPASLSPATARAAAAAKGSEDHALRAGQTAEPPQLTASLLPLQRSSSDAPYGTSEPSSTEAAAKAAAQSNAARAEFVDIRSTHEPGAEITRGAEPVALPQPDASLLTAAPVGAHTATAPHAPPAVQEPRHIAATVGTRDWDDGFAQQVALVFKDGEQSAQLRLDPPDLGPLEVRLTIASEKEGVAHAQFVSAHAAVRDAIEAALPQLRAVLAESGITLGQASVGEGYARDDTRQPPSGSGARNREAHDADGAVAMPAAPVVRRGLVDTFA